MSNCVHIEGYNVIVIPKKDLDEKFFKTVTEAVNAPDIANMSKTELNRLYDGSEFGMFYWFMSTNVLVGTSQISIALGDGRSTHTWRDLEGLFKVLSNHYTGSKLTTSLMVSDEGDGFRSVHGEKFTLGS